MQLTGELQKKYNSIIKLLDQEQLDGVVLSTQANFAWFTRGGDNHVSTASELGAAHIVATRDKVWAICENIERARIENEEAGKLGIPVESYNWWEGQQRQTIERLVGSSNYGSDTGIFGSKNIESSLAPFRFALLPEEIDRYRWVARHAAECMDHACREVRPGMTEHQIAAVLNESIISLGMIPQVALIAADERISLYRHPIPTEKKLEKHVMLVTGARRWGLAVSISRIVHFGEISEELRRKHNACARIDAALIRYTRPGNKVADILNAAIKTYAETGYPEEWKLHHQGGSTGYKAREFRGLPDSPHTVLENQAYAWNPSITGTKTEDTIITLADRNEIMSEIAGWPMVAVDMDGETILRPDILIR